MERIDVEKLAQLARIDMSKEEMDEFLGSIAPVLDYVAQLSSISTEKREPDAGDVYNVMRDDTAPTEPGTYTEDILAEAPALKDGYLKVKRIL